MRTLHLSALLVLSGIHPLAMNAEPPIRLDGEFDDWSRVETQDATDPTGETGSAFDLSRVSSLVDSTTIYLRFDSQTALNLQSGPEPDGTLRLRFELPNERELSVDLRKRQAMLHSSDAVRPVPWSNLRFASLPTYAAKDFELRIDLAGVGVQVGDTVTLHIEGSEQLSQPISLVMQSDAKPYTSQLDLKQPSGSIRVVSMNTLRQGSASRKRAPAIKQLFQFADADIYCFNEALEEDIFRASCSNVLPKRMAGTTNVHWAATCAIVSRFPLTPLSFECEEAAALIDVPGDRHLVVVASHFQCCGFAGSPEDHQRVAQVELLLSDVRRMRAGEFGADAASAAVMVLGDFNLVGSRKPLDLINAAGLKDVMLRCPVDGSAMTWRGLAPEESFWPGRLDYVTVDTERLTALGGFIMSAEQLGRYDSRLATNGRASDHSMLVVDVVPR